MSKNRNIYMIVTEDKYELPLFVGTVEEVAEKAGCSVNTIYACISHYEHGRNKNTRYRRVILEGEDE